MRPRTFLALVPVNIALFTLFGCSTSAARNSSRSDSDDWGWGCYHHDTSRNIAVRVAYFHESSSPDVDITDITGRAGNPHVDTNLYFMDDTRDFLATIEQKPWKPSNINREGLPGNCTLTHMLASGWEKEVIVYHFPDGVVFKPDVPTFIMTMILYRAGHRLVMDVYDTTPTLGAGDGLEDIINHIILK